MCTRQGEGAACRLHHEDVCAMQLKPRGRGAKLAQVAISDSNSGQASFMGKCMMLHCMVLGGGQQVWDQCVGACASPAACRHILRHLHQPRHIRCSDHLHCPQTAARSYSVQDCCPIMDQLWAAHTSQCSGEKPGVSHSEHHQGRWHCGCGCAAHCFIAMRGGCYRGACMQPVLLLQLQHV